MPKSQEFPKVFGKLTVKTGRAVELPGYGTIEIASYSHEKNRALLVFKPIVPPAGESNEDALMRIVDQMGCQRGLRERFEALIGGFKSNVQWPALYQQIPPSKPEEAWPGIPLPAKEPTVDGVGGPQ